jgi:hypothetical protein
VKRDVMKTVAIYIESNPLTSERPSEALRVAVGLALTEQLQVVLSVADFTWFNQVETWQGAALAQVAWREWQQLNLSVVPLDQIEAGIPVVTF